MTAPATSCGTAEGVPCWLLRLVWALRGKRRVRVHIDDGPSVEGILAGCWGGHYILLAPTVLEAEDRTVGVEGHLEIPSWRVIFIQTLDRGTA